MRIDISTIKRKIFEIKSDDEFNETALSIFHWQAEENPVYNNFLISLGINHNKINKIQEIPFLPIDFFKNHKILCTGFEHKIIFRSSGTGNIGQSLNYLADPDLYEESFTRCFTRFYGHPENYNILALLPSYLEREGSSLIYMANHLINLSKSEHSGFFLNEYDKLLHIIDSTKKDNRKTILLGVSFALMDLASYDNCGMPHVIVMETGGMKGRRKEIIREELHEILTSKFNVKTIHSEYGMTELCSQAYSYGDGIFKCPPWMKVLARDPGDPLSAPEFSGKGGLNVIDLANLYSCSFIATQDLCDIYPDGQFNVSGRFDNSEIRGCNQMVN